MLLTCRFLSQGLAVPAGARCGLPSQGSSWAGMHVQCPLACEKGEWSLLKTEAGRFNRHFQLLFGLVNPEAYE